MLVFDAAQFADRATYEEPTLLAVGMRYVIVNGSLAIDDAKYTGALARRVLTKLGILAALGALAADARAQCPDGSPPPCGQPARATAPARNSVAVLYFENATRDSADAYVADGLTEAIIVRLGALERLQVKSRGAVRPLRREAAQDPSVIGRRLGVAYLVSGSVRRAAQRLRVTVELVQSANSLQLWAQQYDRPDGDVLALEQDIAESVAAAIAGRLLPAERASLAKRPTFVPEAYNQFLRGNYYLAQRTSDAFSRALSAYDRALHADPAFTAARARIALTYAFSVGWDYEVNGLPPDSLLPRGLAAAAGALRADSTAADAWLALGLLRGHDLQSTSTEVLGALDRAIKHDPRSAEAHHVRGWYLFVEGQDSLARVAFRRALRLEPERAVTLYYLGREAELGRRFAECLALADSTLALDRAFGAGFILRAGCRAQTGDLVGARADAAEAVRLATGGGSAALAVVRAAFVELRAGDTAAIRRRLVSELARANAARTDLSEAYTLGALHAFLGEPALAVAALEPLRRRPGTWRMELRQPEWDVIRDYAPFARLVHDLNTQQRGR